MVTERFWETFPGPGMAIATILVAGFLLVYWLGAKGFCSYGCPYGAFFAIGDRVTILKQGRVVGSIDHECGTRRIGQLGGLKLKMPMTTLGAAAAAGEEAGDDAAGGAGLAADLQVPVGAAGGD